MLESILCRRSMLVPDCCFFGVGTKWKFALFLGLEVYTYFRGWIQVKIIPRKWTGNLIWRSLDIDRDFVLPSVTVSWSPKNDMELVLAHSISVNVLLGVSRCGSALVIVSGFVSTIAELIWRSFKIHSFFFLSFSFFQHRIMQWSWFYRVEFAKLFSIFDVGKYSM